MGAGHAEDSVLDVKAFLTHPSCGRPQRRGGDCGVALAPGHGGGVKIGHDPVLSVR